jgi:hypothetical protein
MFGWTTNPLINNSCVNYYTKGYLAKTADLKQRMKHMKNTLIIALILAFLNTQAADVESFKSSHVPAKHIITIGPSLQLGNMQIFSTDGGLNLTPLQLVGEDPPAIHVKSIQGGADGYLWMYFNQPVYSVEFDVIGAEPGAWGDYIAAFGEQYEGLAQEWIYVLSEKEWTHVAFKFSNPAGLITMYAVPYNLPVRITNISAQ